MGQDFVQEAGGAFGQTGAAADAHRELGGGGRLGGGHRDGDQGGVDGQGVQGRRGEAPAGELGGVQAPQVGDDGRGEVAVGPYGARLGGPQQQAAGRRRQREEGRLEALGELPVLGERPEQGDLRPRPLLSGAQVQEQRQGEVAGRGDAGAVAPQVDRDHDPGAAVARAAGAGAGRRRAVRQGLGQPGREGRVVAGEGSAEPQGLFGARGGAAQG